MMRKIAPSSDRLAEEPELESDEGHGQDGRRVVDRKAEEHAPLVLPVAQDKAGSARGEPFGGDVERDHREGDAEGAEAAEDRGRIGEHADVHHEKGHEKGVARKLTRFISTPDSGMKRLRRSAGDEGADYRLEAGEAGSEGADEDEGDDEDELDGPVGLRLAEEELGRLGNEDGREQGPGEGERRASSPSRASRRLPAKRAPRRRGRLWRSYRSGCTALAAAIAGALSARGRASRR